MRRSGPSLVFILFMAAAVTLAVAECAQAGNSGTVLAGGYWYGFKRFWGGIFGSVGGVVLIALAVGATSLIIITRGKWRK